MGVAIGFDTNTEGPFNWLIMAVCAIPIIMTIHSLYIILLVGVMSKDTSLSKRPINILLLIDEILRFIGSIGTLFAATLVTMWNEVKVINVKLAEVRRAWLSFSLF